VSNAVHCDIGDLNVGQQSTISLSATPTTGGVFGNTATVTMTGTDTHPANKAVTVSVQPKWPSKSDVFRPTRTGRERVKRRACYESPAVSHMGAVLEFERRQWRSNSTLFPLSPGVRRTT
jgi:hypothetical protein